MEQTLELRAGPHSALSRFILKYFKDSECTHHEYLALPLASWLQFYVSA